MLPTSEIMEFKNKNDPTLISSSPPLSPLIINENSPSNDSNRHLSPADVLVITPNRKKSMFSSPNTRSDPTLGFLDFNSDSSEDSEGEGCSPTSVSIFDSPSFLNFLDSQSPGSPRTSLTATLDNFSTPRRSKLFLNCQHDIGC